MIKSLIKYIWIRLKIILSDAMAEEEINEELLKTAKKLKSNIWSQELLNQLKNKNESGRKEKGPMWEAR